MRIVSKFVLPLIVAVTLLCSNVLFSQSLSVSVTHADVDQLSVGDIDFENFGSTHWFFTISIQTDIPREVKMSVDIDVRLAADNFPGAVSFVTEPFSAPRTMTNLDIGKNGDIKIQSGSFQYSEEAKNKIKNIALSTGKLPAGTYVFNIKVEDAIVPAVEDSKQIVLTLQNVSRVELLSPQNNSEVPNTFPIFQWAYEGSDVELSVYEKSAQHQSDEEAFTGTPYLTARTGDPLLPAGVRRFQYPPAGGRALEAGKTYVWKVRGIASGSGGDDVGIDSPIWNFTVANTSSGQHPLTSGSPDQIATQDTVTNLLTEIPGINAEAVQRILSQYQMTGDVFLNGQLISFLELKRLLDELLANPDRIVQMEVIDIP